MVQIGKGLSHYLWWLPNNSGGVLLCVEFKCRLLRLTRGSFSGSVFLMGRLFQYKSIGLAQSYQSISIKFGRILFRPPAFLFYPLKSHFAPWNCVKFE
jgi:hypothetical protein